MSRKIKTICQELSLEKSAAIDPETLQAVGYTVAGLAASAAPFVKDYLHVHKTEKMKNKLTEMGVDVNRADKALFGSADYQKKHITPEVDLHERVRNLNRFKKPESLNEYIAGTVVGSIGDIWKKRDREGHEKELAYVDGLNPAQKAEYKRYRDHAFPADEYKKYSPEHHERRKTVKNWEDILLKGQSTELTSEKAKMIKREGQAGAEKTRSLLAESSPLKKTVKSVADEMEKVPGIAQKLRQLATKRTF